MLIFTVVRSAYYYAADRQKKAPFKKRTTPTPQSNYS